MSNKRVNKHILVDVCTGKLPDGVPPSDTTPYQWQNIRSDMPPSSAGLEACVDSKQAADAGALRLVPWGQGLRETMNLATIVKGSGRDGGAPLWRALMTPALIGLAVMLWDVRDIHGVSLSREVGNHRPARPCGCQIALSVRERRPKKCGKAGPVSRGAPPSLH